MTGPGLAARFRVAACLLAGTLAGAGAQAAEQPQDPSPPMAGRTGKERLGDKASDEQRVDDCKVTPERRTKPRPDACEWAGS